LPTPSPTESPDLVVLPRTLNVPLTKPEAGEGILYLVNNNRQAQDWVLSLTTPSGDPLTGVNWTVALENGRYNSTGNTIDGFVGGEGYAVVFVTFTPNGLSTGETQMIGTISTTLSGVIGGMVRDIIVPIVLDVSATADADKTAIELTELPVLGQTWSDGLRIIPKDMDSLAIVKDTGEQFSVSLDSVPSGSGDDDDDVQSATCTVDWLDGVKTYGASCEIPSEGGKAGDWRLRVLLTLATNANVTRTVADAFVQMRCPGGEYEQTSTNDCEPCNVGMECFGDEPSQNPGNELQTLAIADGFWRHDVDSEEIRVQANATPRCLALRVAGLRLCVSQLTVRSARRCAGMPNGAEGLPSDERHGEHLP